MIRDLKPYPSYKDSGVPWLGQVPAHWDVVPSRALFAEVKERNHPHEEMLSVTITRGVIRQQALLAASSKKDSSNQDKAAYKLVQPGDIAYNKMRAWQGAIGVSNYRGIVSPAYVVIRLREGHHSRYFHHLLRTPTFAKEAERWSYGITSDQWSLRPEHFKMIYCSLPPSIEQSTIVRFLDLADRRILRYIRAKKKLVALLNEQKQAIIHRVVTRGLDPNVRLKPSGVEWLGEVPEHWEIWQIGHLARVGNGSTPSRANMGYWSGGSHPWLNSSSVNRDRISWADQFVTELAMQECHLPRVQPGSVLVAITGQGRTRGTAAVLEIEATINQHIAYITPRRSVIESEFLRLALVGAYQELRAMSNDSGSTKGALTCGDIAHFKIALPPIGEQLNIVTAIRQSTSNNELAAMRMECEIDLLSEYRTRLIADVVTGKLDVREAAARLPEEAAEDEPLAEDEAIEDSDEVDEGADLDTGSGEALA